MVKINLIYVVVGVILIAFLAALRKKNGRKDGYRYSSYPYIKGGNGDDCIIRNGMMVCREKGIFPAWFYPSYYRRGYGYGYGYPYYGYGYPYYGYGHGYPRYGHGGYGGRRRWGRRGGRRR